MQRKKIIGIYKITSPTGKVYIGQSWDISKRLCKHKISIGKVNNKLYSSCLKYGWNAHTKEIIHQFDNSVTQSILDEYEIMYMDQYDKEYELLNIRDGGSRGKNTESTILKMITAKLDNPPFIGKAHTQDAKIKISNGMKGNNNGLGKKHSEETKKKLSEYRKNLPQQAKDNLSKALTGRKRSKESIIKQSNTRKNKFK